MASLTTLTENTLPNTIDMVNQTYYKIVSELKCTLSKEKIEQCVKDITKEIVSLSDQLTKISESDEYRLINGQGKEINLEADLDYHRLIELMKNISDYYCFKGISHLMEEAGCNTNKNLNYSQIQDMIFDMPYEKQAKIISKMFLRNGTYTYKVATEYSYTADVVEIDGKKMYSNIKAHPVKIEERGIPLYTCRGYGSTIFGLSLKDI